MEEVKVLAILVGALGVVGLVIIFYGMYKIIKEMLAYFKQGDSEYESENKRVKIIKSKREWKL